MVAGWLLCQTLFFAAPMAAPLLAAAADVCTCPGGTPGALCPMHHHGLGLPDASESSNPALRNGCAAPDVALLSLASGFGVLAKSPVVVVEATATTVPTFSSTPIERTEVPEAPPPRA